MEAANNARMSLQDRVNSVFENELLLDNILNLVIENDEMDYLSYADVRSCRLVSKAWMHSISRILRKCRKPVFNLSLDTENSLSTSAVVVENGKCLDNFVKCVSRTSTSPLQNQIPTFKITISEEFFRKENHDSLLRGLSQCGSSLVDLEVLFPDHGGFLTFTFPHLKFPLLKNLRMTFMDDAHMEPVEGETMLGSVNGAYFLQLFFSGSSDIQCLDFESYEGPMPMPSGIDLLSLPPTLTSLAWFNFNELENKHYEPLVRNVFPKLKKLSFPIGATSLAHGLIFKVLDNVKTMLTHLIVSGTGNEPEQSTYFRLPVLEHLKIFETCSKSLKLEDGVSMLQNYVPIIQKVSLERQTTTMFRKWTERSRYNSVRKLTVYLVSENHLRVDDAYDVGFPLEMMRLVEMAFPNIRTLKITVCGTQLCGLKHAFQSLKTLQSLKVNAKRSENIQNSDAWDSLLIGTPVEFAGALRNSRYVGSDLNFGPSIDHQSIKNLTELRKLDLHSYVHADSPLKEIPIISDVAFHFAFLNMPKLKEIRLGGRFKVSSEMMEKWRNQFTGRCIKYH